MSPALLRWKQRIEIELGGARELVVTTLKVYPTAAPQQARIVNMTAISDTMPLTWFRKALDLEAKS